MDDSNLFERVTLNCDMGESYGLYQMGDDDSMLEIIDFANVACGFHAGDFSVMAATVAKAKARGVKIGAHPSFPDRQGFGRREMKMSAEEVKDCVMYQVGALKVFVEAQGLRLSHIKPHGSLFGVATRDANVCRAIVQVCQSLELPLIGMAGTLFESMAKEHGVPFLGEFFADLEYDDNGALIITKKHSPVSPQEAAERVRLALEGKFYSVGGKEFQVHPHTICVHSDTPGAVEVARAMRKVVDTHNMSRKSPRDGIKSVLVANRGEIACRIIDTCKKLGIKTVAIHETVEENATHALQADESVELPQGETYTSINAIVDICTRLKVEAVHPAYGFLSENPSFCQALEDAGVIFLGPTSDTISQFGLKHKARELALKAGVPVVPGSQLLTGVGHAQEEANRLTYPVILKATGGGGGIGMQVCDNKEQLKKSFSECQESAEKHFGTSGVYLEKYYPQSRHIEVQIFGNGKGQVIHLGERECSVQRRNQKVIEETPSPFLCENPHLRREICDAAVRLAKMVNYRSAGTVEFLVVDEGKGKSNTGKFFFLEVNTRLQVEHGVTEMVNGVDLVQWMILQGSNQKGATQELDLSVIRWKPSGYALEARIYAENPCLNFQPSPGLLTQVKWPGTPQVRIDTWIKSGTKVMTIYDPLLAKVMAYGEDRQSAIKTLAEALTQTIIAGPVTNLEYLCSVLKHPDFVSGQTTTQILKKVEYTPQAIRVLQGGVDTTVQDWPGRMAMRVYGIQPNGAMDNLALRVANILVGNDPGTAGLEMTLQGPKLFFHVASLVAVTGADMRLTLTTPDSAPISKSTWSRFYVPKGSTLTIGKAAQGSAGCRCYLAVYGGIDVPDYLGSKSTFTAFGYGGYQGRKLQAGDMLPLGKVADLDLKRKTDLVLHNALRPTYRKTWQIRVMLGPHADPDFVTPQGMLEFLATEWEVHYNSSKMGIRLAGPKPQWARSDGGDGGTHPSNIHDNGYGLGSVNFTGDSGVVLTCDGPTQGGFTCPWSIISAEMWKIGQVSGGDKIRFLPVSIDDALQLRRAQEEYFEHVKQITTHHPNSVPPKIFTIFSTLLTVDVSQKYLGSALLDEVPANSATNQVQVQYRQSGDCYVLVEYGDPIGAVDLNTVARVRVLQDTLRLHTDTNTRRVASPLIPGTLDAAPCLRSLLIRYDSRILPQSTLIQYLKDLEQDIPDIRRVVFPSRVIRLPMTFDDRWSQEATVQYSQQVRKEASYLPSNVEFIAKNNGLEGGKAEVLRFVTNTPFLTVGVGFFLGCPFMCAINPAHRLKVPKYNPSRLYTAAGTVAMGGSFCAIYPLESPGGYQMYGRTIPTWDTFGSVKPFSPHQPWLLSSFDQVTFYPVSEEELLHDRRLAQAGKYKYDIRQATFDMGEYNKLAASVAKERAEMDRKHRLASTKLKTLEEELLSKQTGTLVTAPPEDVIGLPEGHEACPALLPGRVKRVCVQPGDTVTEDTVVCVLEAMKSEMDVQSDVSGTVQKVHVVPGQIVNASDTVCVVRC